MVLELLGALLSLACVGVAVVVTVVLPVVAYRRTRSLKELQDRLAALEGAVRRLQAGLQPSPSAGPEATPPPVPDPTPGVAVKAAAARPPRRPFFPSLPAFPSPDLSRQSVEVWLGQKGLGWLAVVLLLVAAAYFLRYAFDNDWIGRQGQVCLGVLLGTGLCVAGHRRHWLGPRLFGQMLTAAGVVLLYLCTFATFGFFRLLSADVGGGFLVVLVAETFLLAVLYEAPALAWMAVGGALVTPLLLPGDYDHYGGLFLYLLVLNAGVVGLTLARPWPLLALVTLAGSQGIFWLWFARYYHPEKLEPALGFQLALFGMHLAGTVVEHLAWRWPRHPGLLAQQVLLAGFLAAAGYVLLREDYHVWLGSLAVGGAIVYTLLTGATLHRRPDVPLLAVVYLATALAFLAVVFPLQTSSPWVGVGWAAEGLALWWFGLRIESPRLRGLGLAFLALAVGRLLAVDSPPWDRAPFVPLLNGYALPALGVAGSCLAAAESSRRFLPDPNKPQRVLRAVLGLGGVVLVWVVVSRDVEGFFRAGSYDPASRFQAQTALSMVWAVYAVAVLAAGLRLDSSPLRWTALAILGLTLLKVMLVDTAELPGLYRVAVLFALAVVLALAARGYQTFLAHHARAPREGATDEVE